MLEGAIWPILGVLLSGSLVIAVYFLLPFGHAVDRKSVILEMSWKRGTIITVPILLALSRVAPVNRCPDAFVRPISKLAGPKNLRIMSNRSRPTACR
jgi:hypothetical protein